MEVGIVGLPVSGKTTLFATLTGQSKDPAFGGGKIEVHRGIVKIPDRRLDKLTDIFNPKKKVPATIEYIEVGGIESDNTPAKGFDPQFLQALKNTTALCVVIRAFENEFHPHPEGNIDILRDIQTVETEFLLSDLAIVENRISRLEKQIKKVKDDHNLREINLLKRCQETLENEIPLREKMFTEDEENMLRGFQFLSAKPLVYVINIDEADIINEAKIVSTVPPKSKVNVIALCAKAEQEISTLEPQDRNLFLEEMGIHEPALNKLISTSYDLLGLISFFTVGEDECRAWTITRGFTAPQAAGAIHTDFQRGFIRAEVVHYDSFMEHGNLSKCRDKGVLRLEGKNYIVRDGDIMNIRFNV